MTAHKFTYYNRYTDNTEKDFSISVKWHKKTVKYTSDVLISKYVLLYEYQLYFDDNALSRLTILNVIRKIWNRQVKFAWCVDDGTWCNISLCRTFVSTLQNCVPFIYKKKASLKLYLLHAISPLQFFMY